MIMFLYIQVMLIMYIECAVDNVDTVSNLNFSWQFFWIKQVLYLHAFGIHGDIFTDLGLYLSPEENILKHTLTIRKLMSCSFKW